jgi:signal peptidase I
MTRQTACRYQVLNAPMAGRGRSRRVIYWIAVGVVVAAFLGVGGAFGATTRIYSDPSIAMQNTIQPGDSLYVSRGANVRRGDVIVFTRPGIQDAFVRRVIALPGDRVACCDAGRITVNGKPLDETYLYPDSRPPAPFSLVLAAGRMWVMGDNRNIALDSREWGPVPVSAIIGPVVAIRNGGTFTVLRTPSTFIADGLAPAGSGAPLSLILFFAEPVIFVVGVILGVVGLAGWIRRRAARKRKTLKQITDPA